MRMLYQYLTLKKLEKFHFKTGKILHWFRRIIEKS